MNYWGRRGPVAGNASLAKICRHAGLILAPLFLCGVFSPAAWAEETFTITVTNASDGNRIVEIRDVVCGNETRFRDRLDAGESRRVRICANVAGTGEIVAIVASGCASATPTPYENIMRGAEINL